MTGIEGEYEWGSSIFSSPIAQTKEVLQFIRRHAKPLSIFRDLCTNPQTWILAGVTQPSFVELVNFCETRFASNFLMVQRYHALRIVVQHFVSNLEYIAWLQSQKKERQEKANVIRLIMQDVCH